MSHHPYHAPMPGPGWPQPAHGSPLQALAQYLPDVGGRGFWVGAAIGAAAVLLLTSRYAPPASRPEPGQARQP